MGIGSVKHALALSAVYALLGGASGCERDALDIPCPPLAEGDLVISEIRGEQRGDDSFGQWIELYNAGLIDVDLQGLRVRLLRLDGGSEQNLIVRDSIVVASGTYATLGKAAADGSTLDLTYVFAAGLKGSLLSTAVVDVLACDVSIDRVIVRQVPKEGTWALDGASAPNAVNNDDESAFCLDPALGPAEQPGRPGTPQQANPSCS